tara:strand:+ start:366 stop:1007 length:642 start_codon:yes stop_codon:yes gene_type:complete
MGNTKLDVSLETLTLSLTHFIVTGNVALEELVENAVTIADEIALKCLIGFTLTIRIKIRGITINRCIDSPDIRVIAYRPNSLKIERPEVDTALTINPKTPMGAVFRIICVIFRIIRYIEFTSPKTGLEYFVSTKFSISPKNIAKNIILNISLLANAAIGFSGTILLKISIIEFDCNLLASYASTPEIGVAPSPGFIVLTSDKPIKIAIKLVEI